jgi:hypothetical protein
MKLRRGLALLAANFPNCTVQIWVTGSSNASRNTVLAWLGVCCLVGMSGPAPAATEGAIPSPINVADCTVDPRPREIPARLGAPDLGGGHQLFHLVMPSILYEHAQFDLQMYWKHLYGYAYFHEPPPPDNPMLGTEEDIEKYLTSVVKSEQPAGLLVYWRVHRREEQEGGEQELCVGLVLSGKRILVERVPVPDSADIDKLVKFRNSLNLRLAQPRLTNSSADRSPDSGEVTTDLRPNLAAISNALLPGSIRSALASGTVRSLLIVPIGNLAQVPFAALPITPEQNPLIDSTTVTVAPSLRVIHYHESGRRASKAMPDLVVGDPDLSHDPNWDFPLLPGARQEASDVAALLHTTPLLGGSASRRAVLAVLSKPETPAVIYFATHAVTDPKNPQDGSFLALTGRNLLTRDVEKLKLHGQPLVVLSACQTGLGKVFEEGATFGMAQAWYYSGASVVVTSLWNVNDVTTHTLMIDFMQHLSKGSPARALAEAMRMQRDRDSNYIDWASFTVYGGLPLQHIE